MIRFISYTRKLLGTALALVSLAGLSSCERIFDFEGDCEPHYFVEFKYDMNMLNADAFYAKVSSVDLYVFDAADGRFVDHFTESSDILKTPGYRMPLDLGPGSYTLVAWGGLAHNEGRFVTSATVNREVDNIEELRVRLDRTVDPDDSHHSRINLDYNTQDVPCALYHGKIDVELPDQEGTHIYTVPLTKDTNNILVSIWHRYGELDPKHYEFKLVYPDDQSNGSLHHTNSVLEDNSITYHPWSLRSGDLDLGDVIPGLGETDSRSEGYDTPQGKFITAEISTSRLLADHNPRLVIYDTEARTERLNIPFIQYINSYRSMNYRNMTNQEYLDRQDDYTVAIILDSSWVGFELVIQGWHIIDNGDIDI